MKTTNSVLGILGGLGLGVALGVLFAPDKGTETRKKIKNKSKDFNDDIKSKFDDLIRLLENKVSKSETKVKEIVSEGKSLLEETNKDIVSEIK